MQGVEDALDILGAGKVERAGALRCYRLSRQEVTLHTLNSTAYISIMSSTPGTLS